MIICSGSTYAVVIYCFLEIRSLAQVAQVSRRKCHDWPLVVNIDIYICKKTLYCTQNDCSNIERQYNGAIVTLDKSD